VALSSAAHRTTTQLNPPNLLFHACSWGHSAWCRLPLACLGRNACEAQALAQAVPRKQTYSACFHGTMPALLLRPHERPAARALITSHLESDAAIECTLCDQEQLLQLGDCKGLEDKSSGASQVEIHGCLAHRPPRPCVSKEPHTPGAHEMLG